MSRLLQQLGHEALVADARKLRFIYGNDQKADDVDAEMLGRVARLDPKLLSPIEHRPEGEAVALALLHSSDALVGARTTLVNHARGTAKSNGERLPSDATERFHRLEDALPRHTRLGARSGAGGDQELAIKAIDRVALGY